MKVHRREIVAGLVVGSVVVATDAMQATAQPAGVAAGLAQGEPGRPLTAPPKSDPRPIGLTDAYATEISGAPGFFGVVEFSTLSRFADAVLPPMGGKIGALQARAPDYLDFYVGRSNMAQQNWYKAGLADLERRARRQFGKAFATLDDTQIGAVLAPLFQPVAPSRSTVKRGPFATELQMDVRKATFNSPEWAEAQQRAGARIPALKYWRKVDPTIIRAA